MATTPKAVRKNTKAKTSFNKKFSKLENASENLKPGSPKKAKEAVRTMVKKENAAYGRVQKTRTAARKVKMGK
jgi:hypothetical protein